MRNGTTPKKNHPTGGVLEGDPKTINSISRSLLIAARIWEPNLLVAMRNKGLSFYLAAVSLRKISYMPRQVTLVHATRLLKEHLQTSAAPNRDPRNVQREVLDGNKRPCAAPWKFFSPPSTHPPSRQTPTTAPPPRPDSWQLQTSRYLVVTSRLPLAPPSPLSPSVSSRSVAYHSGSKTSWTMHLAG